MRRLFSTRLWYLVTAEIAIIAGITYWWLVLTKVIPPPRATTVKRPDSTGSGLAAAASIVAVGYGLGALRLFWRGSVLILVAAALAGSILIAAVVTVFS